MSGVGFATLSVIPSTRNFGPLLTRQIAPEMAVAGRTAGLGFGKSMGLGARAGVMAGIAAMVGVLAVGYKGALAASAGNAQLAAGLKSTGGAANVSMKELDKLSSSIRDYSGQTKGSIRQTESLLLTFTNIKNSGPNKIFDLTTQAAADMAAKFGGDASDQAVRLGRAMQDPIKGATALQRAGVQFTQSQRDSIKAMVEHGDVVGAQKVILKELATEFGGAAKAAGDSLPGQLSKAKNAFTGMATVIVQTLLPAVLPSLTKIGDVITKQVMPAIGSFFKEMQLGQGAGGVFAAAIALVWGVLQSVAGFITGTGLPALGKFLQGVKDNRDTLQALAEFIGVVLLPVFVNMAVSAVASAATQVGAWVSAQVAGGTSALSQLGSHYIVVGGWVASAAAATASGAVTVAIWALYASEAIAGAAKTVWNIALVSAAWVVTGVKAAAAGVITAAVWLAQASEGSAGSVKVITQLAIVGGAWVAMGASATAAGVAAGAAWLVAMGPLALIAGALAGIVAALAWIGNHQPDWAKSTPVPEGKLPRWAGGGSGLFRAAGGPVFAGQPYVVGEHRAEWFVPSVNGTILPEVPTGGGGNTFYIYETVSAAATAMQVSRRQAQLAAI